MNKKLMCGLMMSVSLFSISAYAADGDDALTTKKYVNDGLSFVYKVANGTENGAVKTLQQQVGDSTAGLIKDVADIQNALSDGNNGLINVGNLANAVGAKGTGGAAGTGLAGDVQSLETAIGDDTTGLIKDVADLQETIGDGTTTGLAKDVADLQETIGDTTSGLVKKVNDLAASSNVYEAGAGIKVTPGATENDPSTISVKLPDGAQNGENYVFQANSNGGTWTKMEVADTWNPGFLTNP